MFRYFLSIRAFFLLISVAAVALSVTGCGGSSQGSQGSTTEIAVEAGSLSKAQFIDQANQLCAKSRAQFERQYREFLENEESNKGEKSSTAEVRTAIVRTIIVPVYDKLVDQTAALGAPSGDEKQVSGILNALQESVDKLKDKPSAVVNNPNPFGRTPKLASDYGLDTCAEKLS